MARHITLPSTAFNDVKSLLRLDEDKLRALGDLFSTSASIAPHAADFMREVTERLDIDTPTAESVVLVCQFLLTVVEEGNRPQDILNDVHEFVTQHASADQEDIISAFDRKRKVLEFLLTPKPARSKALKLQYLAHGLYPTVDSFRTVCELRPVFERPKEQETIVGYVPMIILEVKSSDTEGDGQTVFLHLTSNKLKSLKETIARTEEKLAAIQARFGNELLAE